MRSIERATVLDVLWQGPHSLEDACKADTSEDYGLYQVYGTHAVLGSDCLLYIGLTKDGGEKRRFGQRFLEHAEEWIKWENLITGIYLGRLGGIEPIDESRHKEWGDMIARAESLLIYYCSPPYNSKGIKQIDKTAPPTIVMNFGRRHRLPMIVSNLYEQSPVDDDVFKPYSV